jgi:hypothetical protein
VVSSKPWSVVLDPSSQSNKLANDGALIRMDAWWAQRDATSAATIKAVVAAAQKRVFDVNLREPFVDQEAILACMHDLYLMKVHLDLP